MTDASLMKKKFAESIIDNLFVCPNATYQKKKVSTQILFVFFKNNLFLFWDIFKFHSGNIYYSKF